MGNSDIQQKLQQGIAAARSGNRAMGRRLLLQVTQADPKNEQAWIWLASCVTTMRERRVCLERVLEINPKNEIAQRAIQQLESAAEEEGEKVPTQQRPAPRPQAQAPARARRRRISPGMLVAYVGVALLLVVAGVFLAISGNEEPAALAPTQTDTPDAIALQATLITFTPTITNTPGPTNTPVLVFNPNSLAPTLPPTFTPSPSPTSTPPPPPTSTPFPLAEMPALAVSQRLGETAPGLYAYLGDGTEQQLITTGVQEVAYDASGTRLAYVAVANGLPQLFVAQADNPASAQQISQFSSDLLSSLSWSPDGTELVFTSNANGSEDIWYVPVAEPNRLRALTNTPDIIERDPAWSPIAGSREITFASDRDGIGQTELYRMEIPRQGVEPQPVQVTDGSGSTYSPFWSANGEKLLFISDRRGDPDIFIADPDGSGAFLITVDDGDAEDRNPSFTPDERFIVFSSNRLDDRFQIYLVSPDGLTLERITNNDREDIQFVYRPIPNLLAP